MAFPTTGVLDDFDRASIGSNYTAIYGGGGLPRIVSSTIIDKGASSFCDAFYNVATYGADSEVYIDIVTKPANGNYVWLYARLQTPTTSGFDGYELQCNALAGTDTIELYRCVNTVFTLLATYTVEFASGDSVGMDVTGTGATVAVTAYRRPSGGSWGAVGTYNDTNWNRITAAGYVGLGGGGDSGWRLDNLGGGTVVTATETIPYLVMAPPIAA